MKSLAIVLGTVLVVTGAFATPPGPGKHFDCSDAPGASSCASDDTGCVPDTKDHRKCADAIAKAFGKAIRAVIACHKKQADARFKLVTDSVAGAAEDTCSTSGAGKSAKEKLEAAINKVSTLCSPAQLSEADTEKATLFADKSNPASLDARNAGVYCDSTAGAVSIDGSGDDAGWVPHTKDQLKCADAVGSASGKLTAAAIKCHQKMAGAFFKMKDFDESICEELDPAKHKSALEKYAHAMDTLDTKGTCTQGCLDRTSRDALGVNALALAESSNARFYPCVTTTTTTTTTTSTTTTTCPPAACTCAGGTPTTFTFSTGIGSGICGHLDSDTTASFSPLVCGGLYFGGAGVGVPLPTVVPDYGNSKVSVCCNATTLTMHGTTPAEAGGNRCSGGANHGNSCTSNAGCPGGACKFLNCTNAGCLYGAPLPVPNGSHGGAATSTCIINSISANATGHLDCSTGATTDFDLPLSSALFLTGDSLLPNRCSGGPTPGKGCTTNADCGTGGTCVNDTGRCTDDGSPCVQNSDCTAGTCETGVCSSGTNDGKGCITSADCPGGKCRTLIQPCPICNLTTGTCNGGPNDGLSCTPGDTIDDGDFPTSHDCPPPPGAGIGALPIAYLLSTGTLSKVATDLTDQVNVFCGFCKNKVTGVFKNPAVPCAANANCSTVTGFTSCGQRTSGAFTADDVTRTITETGSPTGALTTGGPAKPITLVSIFCIPPTYSTIVDSAADLPGPGAVALPGTGMLQ